MALVDITRDAVLAAIAEHDQLGQEEFAEQVAGSRAARLIAGAAREDLPACAPPTGLFLDVDLTSLDLVRRLPPPPSG